MTRDLSLPELLDAWRSGDQQAASAIYQRYAQRIFHFAQRRINPKFYPRFDGEDILATVLRTVLGRLQEGQYSVDSKGSMWNLMAKVARNKNYKYAEKHEAKKCDINREVGGEDAEKILDTISRQELSPGDLAAFADELDGIRSKMKSDMFAILDLHLQGYSNHGIAERVGSHINTVAPKVVDLKEKLAKRGKRYE